MSDFPLMHSFRACLHPVDVELPETHSLRLAEAVRESMRRQAQQLAVLESCTGGLISSLLTDADGAGYLLGSGVTYSVEAKLKFGVPGDVISEHGLVSKEVAQAMCTAARDWFGSDVALAITGSAGEPAEGAGLAYVAVCDSDSSQVTPIWVPGERREAKLEMAQLALGALLEFLDRFRSQRPSESVSAWIGR